MGCDSYCYGGSTSRCDINGDLNSSESWDHRLRNSKRRRMLIPCRRWVESDNSLLNSGEDRFMLISYNILGVDNSLEHPDLYINVPFNVMQWESRKQLICEDIRRCGADIVCLQEVDRYYDLENCMKMNGYVGRFKHRTGDAKDGCAIFWRKKRFHLVDEHEIEFKDFGLRDNVAQLFVFETGKSKIDSRRVVVGNIHALFNPKRGDIKLGQVRILLQDAHALSKKWGGIPLVLAGDFNCTPQSAIYEFLSTSELNISRHDRRYLSGNERFQPTHNSSSGLINHFWSDEELKNATGDSSCKLLTHPFNLHSSYARISGTGGTRDSCGEPLCTTYHSKFMGTVDYHWFSEELEPARVLDTLPIGALKSIGGLPSQNIGSDHLALASEFVFITRRSIDPQNKEISKKNSQLKK